MKKIVVTAALTFSTIVPSYATVFNITGTFTMFKPNPSGAQMQPPDTTITGTYDDEDPTSMRIETTTPFFAFIWKAYNLQITTIPGDYEVNACPEPADGSIVPIGGGDFTACTPPIIMDMPVAEGQWGVQMLFDWNRATLIDVVNVWDVTNNPDGSIQLTSTDFDNDGIPSSGMADGPFQGNNASFNLLLSPPFAVNITASQNGSALVLDPLATENVTFDATTADASAYDWTRSDPAILNAAIGDTNNATLIIDQTDAGLVAGQTYNIIAKVTKPTESGDSISTGSTTIRVASFALTDADTDGDGTNDNQEGFSDTDGDRIPEFLDTASTATELTVNPADNSLGNIVTNEGTVALGDSSFQNAINNLNSTTDNNFGAAISVTTIAENDDNFFKSFCMGGCMDISVTNVTSPSIQVVVPLSTTIPDHAVLRVRNSIGWIGFEIDSNNYLESAAANSTSPLDCPAPGHSAYSPGLTKGDRCIQITIEDNGPNDTSSLASGKVSVLTSTAELIISESTTNGVGGINWLLLGFPALLGFRRFKHK